MGIDLSILLRTRVVLRHKMPCLKNTSPRRLYCMAFSPFIINIILYILSYYSYHNE